MARCYLPWKACGAQKGLHWLRAIQTMQGLLWPPLAGPCYAHRFLGTPWKPLDAAAIPSVRHGCFYGFADPSQSRGDVILVGSAARVLV